MPVTELMKIRSNLRDYPVRLASGGDFVGDLAARQNVLFAIDKTVWQLHGTGTLKPLAGHDHILIEISEERKSLPTVQELYDQIIQRAPKKNLLLVAIGGGILQDLVGFVASTLYRGIAWIFVPTTLLAQTDSSIGAKTSLNYRNYKNLIGTFYPPTEVIIDTAFLSTQKDVDYYSGLGEMMKLHLMGGQAAAEGFARDLPALKKREEKALEAGIKKSLSIKQTYIEADEFDTGRRNLLNFGHCFGHALETATDYAIPHGQAVAIGILLANRVAAERGLLSFDINNKLAAELVWPVINLDLKKIRVKTDKVIEAMKKDKKRVGAGLALVMMKDGYEFIKVDDLSENEAGQAMEKLVGREQ